MNDKPTRAQRDCFSIFCLILHSRCEIVEMYSPPGGVSRTAVFESAAIARAVCRDIFSRIGDHNFGIKRLPNGQFQLAVYFSDGERL